MKDRRPSIDEYFLMIASIIAKRSTCLRHDVGAVAVRDKYLLSAGYNGASAGMPDCLELGCLRDQQNIRSGTRHEICRAVHAEQNVIIQAALHGVSLEEATIYCTHSPCILCAKSLVNAKVKRLVVAQSYPDKDAVRVIKEAGIQFDILPMPDVCKIEHIERVLVVDSEVIVSLKLKEGLTTENLKKDYEKIRKSCRFEEKDDAEGNPNWRQLIAFVLLRYKNEYMINLRPESDDEERLHNKYFLCVGGHIDLIDSSEQKGDIIEKGMKRELFEEIKCNPKNIKLIGILKKDVNKVDKEHIGLIYKADLKNKEIEVIAKSEITKERFIKSSEIRKFRNKLDTWSKVIFDEYIRK